MNGLNAAQLSYETNISEIQSTFAPFKMNYRRGETAQVKNKQREAK
jgi:hypothetical protein